MNRIETFIQSFKQLHPIETENIFLYGDCFYFALILEYRFKGEICYLPIENHFITRIENQYYDVSGIVIPEEKVYTWKEFKAFDPVAANRVEKYCILQTK